MTVASPPLASASFSQDELARLCEMARAFLAEFAKDNAPRGSELRLASAEGGIYRFPGELTVTLKTHTDERRIEGRLAQGGPVVSTRAEAGRTLAGLERAAQKGEPVRRAIARLFAEEEAAGFGLEKDRRIALPESKSEFSMTEQCQECAGIGQRSCTHCLGQGMIPCATCRGQGQQICPACHGARHVNDPNGQSHSCAACNAQGYQVCGQCRGQMRVNCPKCGATMQEPCVACNQTGWHSVVFENRFDLSFSFSADLGVLPPDVARAVLARGLKKMARDGDIAITPDIGVTATGALKGIYDAVLPVAAVEFTLGGASFSALIAGQNARVIATDAFLDPVVKPGIVALQSIAKGPMATGPLIATACRFRLLRGVLSDLMHRTRKQSYQRLLAAYPLILSEKYAKASVKYAAQALESLTAKARRGGAILGALAAGVFYRLWFDPVLQQKMPARLPAQVDLALDGLAVLAGIFMAIYVVRVRTLSSLRNTLPAEIALNRLPVAGKWGNRAALMALLLLIPVMETVGQAPRWYQILRHQLPF